MQAKTLSDDEKAVVRDLVARHGGKLAFRPNESAVLFGERAFWDFMSEWTALVAAACQSAVNRKIDEEISNYEK